MEVMTILGDLYEFGGSLSDFKSNLSHPHQSK